MKDKLLEEKDSQIKNLRKRLKKAQQKLWYLENVKKKLNSAFLELKKQSLVTEEQCKVLRVCFFNFFSNFLTYDPFDKLTKIRFC